MSTPVSPVRRNRGRANTSLRNELLILAACTRPTHGYALRDVLTSAGGPLDNLSWGSLYPALHRLTQTGLLTSLAKAQEGRRQPYLISPTGWAYLTGRLGHLQMSDRIFSFCLRLFTHLTPATRTQLLRARQAHLHQVAALEQRAHTNPAEGEAWQVHLWHLARRRESNEAEVDALFDLVDQPTVPLPAADEAAAGQLEMKEIK